MLVPWLLGWLMTVTLGSDRHLPAVRFQTDSAVSSDSFLDTGHGVLKDLTQISVCVHLRPLHLSTAMPILSYLTSSSDGDLHLDIKGESQMLSFSCCGSSVDVELRVPFSLYVWQHLCLAVDLVSDLVLLAYDNLREERQLQVHTTKLRPGERPVVIGGGRLVVGQDVDTMKGEFDVSQSFHGEMADLRLYDIVLTHSQMEAFIACTEGFSISHEAPFISFETNSFEMKGSTEELNVTEKELCHRNPGYSMLFPEKQNFESALLWCAKLRGEVAVPTSSEDNAQIYDKFIHFNGECLGLWQGLYWVGVRGDLTSGQWVRLADGHPIHWHKFKPFWEAVTTKYPCILAGGELHPYEWYHAPCTVKSCVVCNFTSPPQVHLRGLCQSSLFDRSLYLHEYFNNRPKFDGAWHSRIVWKNDSWVMESRMYPQLSAQMIDQMDYPIGLHLWKIKGDKCNQKQAHLLLTACSINEFTCDDGTCINKSLRCDLSTDCSDNSDELTCDVISVPEGYSADLPPPKDTSEPLPLFFYLKITSIREFNVVTFALTLDVIITLKWNDSRVTFTNLQTDYRKNKVKNSKLLWTPELMVTDGTQSWVQHGHMDGGDLYVTRMTEPMSDDDALLHEDDVYTGSSNSLLYRLHKTLTSRCQLDLKTYPFDNQRCSLFFTVEGITDISGKLVKEGAGLAFTGTRQLLEYNLVEEAVDDLTDHQVTQLKVRLKFTNLFKYYTMNAFLPSLMMVVISYLCFYFDLNDFQDRIMVSLTSLLVLVAFFNQTTQSIPNTAYLKLIDVWYVALISQVFLVIISLICVENLRLRDIHRDKEETVIHVMPFGVPGKEVPDDMSETRLLRTTGNPTCSFLSKNRQSTTTMSLPARVNVFLIIFFPVVFMAFMVYFIATCIDGLRK